jgi:hypothetical protein
MLSVTSSLPRTGWRTSAASPAEHPVRNARSTTRHPNTSAGHQAVDTNRLEYSRSPSFIVLPLRMPTTYRLIRRGMRGLQELGRTVEAQNSLARRGQFGFTPSRALTPQPPSGMRRRAPWPACRSDHPRCCSSGSGPSGATRESWRPAEIEPSPPSSWVGGRANDAPPLVILSDVGVGVVEQRTRKGQDVLL